MNLLNRVGVDLGGTKIEAILLDENLNTLERKRIPTPKNDYDEIISSITNLVSEIFQMFLIFLLEFVRLGQFQNKLE